MRTILSTLICGLTLGIMPTLAQTEGSTTTQPATQAKVYPATELRYRGAISIPKTILSDSVDVAGRSFTAPKTSSLLPYLRAESKTSPMIRPDAKGIFRTPVQGKGQEESHIYTFYILPSSYTEGYLNLESDSDWELFVDGYSVASGKAAKAVVDSIAPSQHSLSLIPTCHEVNLVLSRKVELGKSDTLGLRLGFIPNRREADVLVMGSEMRYPDLRLMVYGSSLSTPRISPSGTYTILPERVWGEKSMTTRYYLYKGGRRISELSGKLGSAKWLPHADKLYYDEKTARGRTLYAIDPVSGERTVLADNIPEGYYSISPQGNKLIYSNESKGPEYKKTLDRFVTPNERIGGFRTRHFLSIFDLKTGAYYPLTFGNRSTYMQDMAEDETKLLFSTTTPTPDKLPFSRTDYYELDLRTMQVDTLFTTDEGVGSVLYTAKAGVYLVTGTAASFDYVGSKLPKGSDVNTYDTQLFLYDRVSRKAKPLSKEFDRTISGVYAMGKGRFEAFFVAELGDRKALHHIDLATGAIRRLSTKEDVLRGYTVASVTGAVAYVGQSVLSSDRFYLVEPRKWNETLAYDFSSEKLKNVRVGTSQDWDWTAPDGTRVQGRFYLPDNFDPKRKYPMLVYYYGGTSPVNRAFEGAYSLAMYASLGYVVYSLNPSGSTGYGQEYAARHINAWGKRTADEIIGAVKAFCQAHDYVDAKRVGCMGASYGGFMTQYLQTQTDIFAAAVSHAGISSIASYWGEGYWGVGYSTVASKGSYPWNNPDLYTKHSPLFLAERINTPLLLIHGLSDTNVPVGESWQMFNALRILGKPVEFVGVYGEDHHILDPEKRYEWSSAIMAFFAKYLQNDPTWWNSLFPPTQL